jgi:hypothetical protein
MAAQAINPSTLRKAHDNLAVDHHPRLPVSQLSEYLLMPDALTVKGKSEQHVAALEALDRTVKSAYEKSPSFRRLFNHAWTSRLRDQQARHSINAGGGSQHSSASELTLPDVLKRSPKPRYESAIGMSRLSDERAILNATVRALTQLPDQEPGHPAALIRNT